MSDNSHNSHDINPPDNSTTNPADTNEPVNSMPNNQRDQPQQSEDAQTQNADTDHNSITSHVLQKIDQFLPEDRENDLVQFIKHDLLEAPTAMLGARKDILDMRSRGQRSLFESKDKGKDGKSAKGKTGKNGKKKDRFSRRMLDTGYMATQATANMMTDEQEDESTSTTGIRTMLQESAKIVKIFATAESAPKDSKIRHVEDEQRLVHENPPEESRLEHDGEDEYLVFLLHDEADGETSLQHGDSGGSSTAEAPAVSSDGKPLKHGDSKGSKPDKDNKNDSKSGEASKTRNENKKDAPNQDETQKDSDTNKTDNRQPDAADTTPDTGDGGSDGTPINQDSEHDNKHDSSSHHKSDGDKNSDTISGNDSDVSSSGDGSSDSSPETPKTKKDIKVENKLDHKIEKYTARAEKLEKQIEKAEAKIPKKKVKVSKLVHDEKSGKDKRKISFVDEKIDKVDAKWNQGQSNTLSANAGRYVTGHASAIVHGKISETENLTGNTGVKAAHKGEQVIVKTYQTAKKIQRHVRNRPYRRLQHLRAKEVQNKGRLAYQKLLKDKPELRKKTNTLSRMFHKRRIKREYAQAFRAAQAGGGVMGKLGAVGAVAGFGAAAVSGDGKAMAKMGARLALKIAMKKAALATVKAVAALFIKLLPFILIIAAVLLLFTMCVSLFGTTTGFMLDAVSYQADADDITTYSVYMTQLEVELKEEIIEAASDVEGLHEFRFTLNSPSGGIDVIFLGTLVEEGLGYPYNTLPVYDPPDFDPLVLLQFLNDIQHNSFEIMAYLTVLYRNFDGYDINAILREIFDTAFELEIVEGYEERYVYVEAWHYEEQDLGEYDSDGNWVSDWQDVRVEPLEERMYYNWYYREVILTVNSTITEVLQDRMDDDQEEHYDLIMESLGLRQFVGSPFEDNWLPNMTSPFGYRFHPITQSREMHTGIDIGLPEGTPILSGAPGVVVFAGDMGGYGNTVIIEYHDEERGVGVRILYAHMADIDVAVGDTLEMGEPIGTVGSTGVSTGPHLHMEVSINEDGGAWRLINPLFFVQPYVS